MKYKLINLQTKEEHLCNKVTIDGFDYYVSDELIKIGDINIPSDFSKITDLSMTSSSDLPIVNEKTNGYKKVIATNSSNIDFPKVVNDYKNAKWWAADLYGYDKNCELPTNDVEVNSFIEGYNKSQETHSNSDEDMVEFAEWIRIKDFQTASKDRWIGLNMQYYTTKELLQLWQEQQPKIVYYNG